MDVPAIDGSDDVLDGKKILKRVVAPPGYLGIFFRDSTTGPCVFRLADESPLVARVAPGWTLHSVDGVCTRHLGCHGAARQMQQHTGSRTLLFAPPRPGGPGWSPYAVVVLIANALIGLVALSWLTCLLPNHLLPLLGAPLSALLTTFGLGLVFHILLNYWRCILVPPGYVPPAAVGDAAPDEPTHCHTCRTVKPPRARHCSKCNRCVLRMDHRETPERKGDTRRPEAMA